MNVRDKIYTGKVADWGLPDGTVLHSCSFPDIEIVCNTNKCNFIKCPGDFFEITPCPYKIKTLPRGYDFDDDGNIKRKQHDYPPLYTYAISLCYCWNMIELRNWIKSLSSTEQN